jgi:hypothetical protein
MRVQRIEPPQHLAAQIADVPPYSPPRRAGVRLAPFFECARRDLQEVRNLRPGHDLHVFVHHDKEVRRGIPGEPVATRSSAGQPWALLPERLRRRVFGTQSGTLGIEQSVWKQEMPLVSAETQGLQLGYLDSNQEQKNQNLPCCQLHHTPPRTGRTEAD